MRSTSCMWWRRGQVSHTVGRSCRPHASTRPSQLLYFSTPPIDSERAGGAPIPPRPPSPPSTRAPCTRLKLGVVRLPPLASGRRGNPGGRAGGARGGGPMRRRTVRQLRPFWWPARGLLLLILKSLTFLPYPYKQPPHPPGACPAPRWWRRRRRWGRRGWGNTWCRC